MDELDGLLRDLGSGAPFEIDWKDYETKLMQKMNRANAAQRRRAWRYSFIGAVAGIAATLMVVQALKHDPELGASHGSVARVDRAPLEADAHVPEREHRTMVCVRGSSSGYMSSEVGITPHDSETAADSVKSYVIKSKGGEIRFNGFSEAGRTEPSFIAVMKPNRKIKVD